MGIIFANVDEDCGVGRQKNGEKYASITTNKMWEN
jgi:hypothetical protein